MSCKYRLKNTATINKKNKSPSNHKNIAELERSRSTFAIQFVRLKKALGFGVQLNSHHFFFKRV